MANWDYNLKTNGAKLRDLIHNADASKENCAQIIEQVIVCCKWLQTHLAEEDKDWDYDIEDLIQECEDTKCYLDEYDWESNEDNINDLLDTFYDLMDTMRVWIGA